MSKVKYVKEPGFVYDLIFIFVLYYNKEICFKKFTNKDKGQQDIDFYEEILNKFAPFPEELRPFFYMKESGGCLVSGYYFHKGLESFFNGHEANYLYNELANAEDLRSSMISFYVSDGTEISDFSDTFALNKSLIKANFPDKIKQWVMAILSNPNEYAKLLIETLTKAEQVVVEYHKQHYNTIIKLCNEVDVTEVQSVWKTANREYNFEDNEISLSVCVLARNIMRFDFIDNRTCFIAGINGKEFLEQKRIREDEIDIPLFGKIISDGSRIKILQMLAEKSEMSTGEIAHGLSTALPSSYYHLEMMLTAGMLCTRNEGRTVYYSIQQEYFQNATDAVLRLIMKGEL